MEFTDTEKVILHNQYQILSAIDPDNARQYELMSKCLRDGYDKDFEALQPHFEPSLSSTVRTEVRQILDMFRSLTPPADSGMTPPVRFRGFDGNEEASHYAYARFLLEDLDLWKESQSNDLNTHSPVLHKYRAMLERWNRARDRWQLTPEDVNEIVSLAPSECRD